MKNFIELIQKKIQKIWIERVFNHPRLHPILVKLYLYKIHKVIQFFMLSLLIIILLLLLEQFAQTAAFHQMVAFLNIWPIYQWISSLVTLILMYWLIGAWYNKKLSKQGGWISWKVRVNMIALDLLINLGLGIYYMNARETLLGAIMLSCPIAISPVIFLIEFLMFIWYYKKYVLKNTKKENK